MIKLWTSENRGSTKTADEQNADAAQVADTWRWYSRGQKSLFLFPTAQRRMNKKNHRDERNKKDEERYGMVEEKNYIKL